MKLTTTLLSLSISAILATGCTVGGDIGDPGGNDPGGNDPGGNDPDPTPVPSYAVAVTSAPSAQLTLGNTADFELLITASNGFSGPVTLSALNVPSTWEAAFAPSNVVNVPVDGTAAVTLSVVVPTDGEALTAEIGFEAEAAPGKRDGKISLEVANRLIVEIPEGTGGGVHPFPLAMSVRVGTAVEIRNADGTAHRIHADDGDIGFPHQPNTMAQGESYPVTFTAARNNVRYYCHSHEQDTSRGSFNVVAAPAP